MNESHAKSLEKIGVACIVNKCSADLPADCEAIGKYLEVELDSCILRGIKTSRWDCQKVIPS
jgi:hypothetical protein